MGLSCSSRLTDSSCSTALGSCKNAACSSDCMTRAEIEMTAIIQAAVESKIGELRKTIMSELDEHLAAMIQSIIPALDPDPVTVANQPVDEEKYDSATELP